MEEGEGNRREGVFGGGVVVTMTEGRHRLAELVAFYVLGLTGFCFASQNSVELHSNPARPCTRRASGNTHPAFPAPQNDFHPMGSGSPWHPHTAAISSRPPRSQPPSKGSDTGISPSLRHKASILANMCIPRRSLYPQGPILTPTYPPSPSIPLHPTQQQPQTGKQPVTPTYTSRGIIINKG